MTTVSAAWSLSVSGKFLGRFPLPIFRLPELGSGTWKQKMSGEVTLSRQAKKLARTVRTEIEEVRLKLADL